MSVPQVLCQSTAKELLNVERDGRDRWTYKIPLPDLLMPRALRTHPRPHLPTQPEWARPRRTTYKGANLDEATPGKAIQRETETTEVGVEDETPHPHIESQPNELQWTMHDSVKCILNLFEKYTERSRASLVLRTSTTMANMISTRSKAYVNKNLSSILPVR